MNKIKKAISIFLALSLCLCLMAGCGDKAVTQTVYELPYYSGTNINEISGLSEYNENLWRRNTELLSGADPFILDNTAQDGYYYLYATNDAAYGFLGYRTTDFSTWECVGRVFTGKDGWSSYWAPEVVSEDNGKGSLTYYLFFSAQPNELAASGAFGKKMMFVATSSSPAGPFELLDFTDAASCGEGNTHTNEGNYSYSDCALFDYEALFEALNEECGTDFSSSNLPSLIDPSPFVDSNGDKYIYFSLEWPRLIIGMKMDNWCKIDYSTVTILSRVGYYTLEDYEKEQAGEEVQKNKYELIGAKVNEGPSMIKHGGKYYLTFSINGYADASYSVMQAVGDSPLGPFTKLGDDQNGLILSSDLRRNAMTSGTGHHSFFYVGDSLYICYHRHNVVGTIDAGRGICVDEVRWVETTGDNGETLDVLYVNGPTVTVQPRFDNDAEYTNIAGEGTVSLINGTLSEGSSVEYLNDGLLSYNVNVNQTFLDKYVGEATTTTDATYEITFNSTREICGFMVYGSKYQDRYFSSVYNIELVAIENGQEKSYCIKELPTGETCYGSGVYAEFDPLNVKSIRFTVKLAEGNQSVGISEIAVIGKRGE